jgi:DNA-binding CsgD family transcriptional regulator
VDAARAGAGGALVVRGEPGVGKTALLDDVVTSLRADPVPDAGDDAGLTVLRTQGIESEAPLAFAALQRLLRPLMPLVGHLPTPQAQALRVAFGEEVGESSDRFLVFLAALSLLAEAAETRTVLALVDDAHWLDDASAAALLFCARRLGVERVALVFAAREGDVRTFDSGDVPELVLGGLGLDAVNDVLAASSGAPVSREVGAQLLASTGGNPLALVELPKVLSADQLAGRASLPGRLPVTGAVERVFLDRARRLSEHAQQFLLVAAADDSTRVAVVSAAAQVLGAGPEAREEAEQSGLASVKDHHLVLRHPLVRSAVYTAATSVERRAVHAALAQAMTAPEDDERRIWHRAASVDEPDAEVVAELETAAARSENRGGYEAAAAAWWRAAELTEEATPRARRLYGAARAAWLAGQPDRARSLADAARIAAAQDPLLEADVVRLRARIEWNTGSVQVAHRMILEGAAAIAPLDPNRAREMAMFAVAIAAFGGDSGIDLDPADFAHPPSDRHGAARDRCFTELLLGLRRVLDADWVGANHLLRAAFATAEELQVNDQDLLPNLGIGALHLGDNAASDTYHERLLTRARNTGAVVMVLYSLTRLGISDLPCGRWSTLVARQSEAVRLGQGTGQPVLAAMPATLLLLLAAYRGEDTYPDQLRALEELEEAQALGILDMIVRDFIKWSRGVHAGVRTPAGFHQLAQISHHIVRRLAGLDRVESAVHAGQHDTARLWVEDLETFGAAAQAPWALAIAELGRALLATTHEGEGPAASPHDVAAADVHFEKALALHRDLDQPFHRARTLLAYGEHLRRTRRRVAAREQLRPAVETFEDLRARPWADRAAQELRASGETARRRDETDTGDVDLTPQELQVAQLVKRGLTNREAAAQLFVSPRTIDFHLRNVYSKTGVTSRTELAQLNLG